jgi:hypothetical protein
VRRLCAVVFALAVAGCWGGGAHARVAAHDDLSAIQAIPVQLRNGGSGAPVSGVNVTGTITNSGSKPLRCTAIAFLLVDDRGNAVSPSSQFCEVQILAPNDSAYFNATFPTQETDNLQLRFEHPDGSYETHDLAVPPA